MPCRDAHADGVLRPNSDAGHVVGFAAVAGGDRVGDGGRHLKGEAGAAPDGGLGRADGQDDDDAISGEGRRE